MTEPRRPTSSTRLVARQVSELLFAHWHHYQGIVPPEKLANMMVQVVLSASLAHLSLRDPRTGQWIGIQDGATHARPVTVQAIANSMRLPYTTVRRQVAAVVEAGCLLRHPQGFTLAPAFFAGGRLADIAAADAADLGRAVSALADAGYRPAVRAAAADVQQLPNGVVERALIAFTLRVWETFTALYGDATFGAIVAAIITANISDVTVDPELSRRYAAEDDIPPDSLRRPIALRDLGRNLNMPFETVRRRTATLIARGIVQRTDTGVFVPAQVLLSQRHLDNNRRIEQHFEQMLATLTALASSGDGAP